MVLPTMYQMYPQILKRPSNNNMRCMANEPSEIPKYGGGVVRLENGHFASLYKGDGQFWRAHVSYLMLNQIRTP